MYKGKLIKIELTSINGEDMTPLPNQLEPEHRVQTVHLIRKESAELPAIKELNMIIDLRYYH